MIQLLKPLPYYIPEASTWYLDRAELPSRRHFREYCHPGEMVNVIS